MNLLAQRSVEFYGNTLIVIHQDGVNYTPIKPICEALGADWESQRQRLERDEVLAAVACVIQATGSDGKRYEMVCLPLEYLNGWLFGVDARRVRPEVRERLITYKRECYQFLARAFQREQGVPLERVAALEARVAALEAVPRLLDAPTSPINSLIVITHSRDDVLTTKQIVDLLLAAHVVVPGASLRGQQMFVAALLRRAGVRQCGRRRAGGCAPRAWVGVRVADEEVKE